MFEQLINQLLIVNINAIQVYLLWFLLGSFTVATLSDLKHLSAQREFLQIWLVLVFAMFITDLYYNFYITQNIAYLSIKWSLIIIFLPLYFHFMHKIAWGDVFAKMAACSLLPPIFIILFIISIRFVDLTTSYVWKRFGTRMRYPFMPVIFCTTLILLVLAMYISQRL